MDKDVSGWILEFLLGQSSLDNGTLDHLIRVLPLPNNNPRLKKGLLLRNIELDIKNSTISDRTIEFLERIEELDLREGSVEVSEAMKAAYCTLAMFCTAKSIEESSGDLKDKYSSTVSRIWSGRIRKIEMSEVAKIVGLVEDDLSRWMSDIEAGVLDVDVCENVLGRFRGLDVLDVLHRYVDEAKQKMGPSFLELACETILSDDALSKTMGLNEGSELVNQIEDTTPPTVVPAVSQDTDANVLPRYKPVGPRCFRKPGHGTNRGAKIIDPMDTNAYNPIPTPELKKVQEALQTSSFKLHEVVKDPLPEALSHAESIKVNTSGENIVEALSHAESIKVNTSGENMGNDHVVGTDNRADVEVEATGISHDRKGKNLEASGNDQRDNRLKKPNLMERNSTAHTVEWSDSIDSPEERSPTRPHLPTPRNRTVSPLNVYKPTKITKHRKKKRWTILEEDTLRTGVQKYGKGNWKQIFNEYRDIFEDRTEVDLKDKWRNLTR